jgi:hypothetical protein
LHVRRSRGSSSPVKKWFARLDQRGIPARRRVHSILTLVCGVPTMSIEQKYPKYAEDVFLLNADRYSSVSNPKVTRVPQGLNFYTVIGGLSGLHLITQLAPASITFIDINPVMVEFGKAVVELIRASDTYLDFWKHYYCRDFGDNILDLPLCPPDRGWKPFPAFQRSVPVVTQWLRGAAPTPALPPKYAHKQYADHYGRIFCLRLAGGRHCWHSVTTNPRYPTCGIHFIFHGFGFHCDTGFAAVRTALLKCPVRFLCGSAFEVDYAPGSYVYLTNLHGLLGREYRPFLDANVARLERDLWVRGDNHAPALRDGRIMKY